MSPSHEINFDQLLTVSTRRSQDILALAFTQRNAHDADDLRNLAEYLGVDYLLPKKPVPTG